MASQKIKDELVERSIKLREEEKALIGMPDSTSAEARKSQKSRIWLAKRDWNHVTDIASREKKS